MNIDIPDVAASVVLAALIIFGIASHLRWLLEASKVIRQIAFGGANGSQMLIEHGRVRGEAMRLTVLGVLFGWLIFRVLGYQQVAFYTIIGAVAILVLEAHLDRGDSQTLLAIEQKRATHEHEATVIESTVEAGGK